MNKRRGLPLYIVIILDILLTAAILLTFCYFHHVRILWGSAENKVVQTFVKTDKPLPEESTTIKHTLHEWTSSAVIKPTCTEGGYTLWLCSCGEQKRDDFTKALGHTALEVRGALEATDKAAGYTGDTYCTVCGTLVVRGNEIPAKSHSNLRLINELAATCTTPGYTGDWYCIDCAEIVAAGVEIPLAAHSPRAERTIAPDCQNEGFTVYKCTVCGAETKDDFTPKGAHSMGKDGSCTVCGICMLDTTGDFGASFPLVFIQQDDGKKILTDADEITAYTSSQGIGLSPSSEDGRFIALYRSHDIFLTVEEINTVLYYPGTGKNYTVRYFVYDIYVRNIENLYTVASDTRKDMTKLMEEGAAASGGSVAAAINGDFMGNTGHCLAAVRNGNVYRAPENTESDICVLFYDGSLETYTPEQYSWDEIASKSPYQIWNFGPALLDKNGKSVEQYDSSAYDSNVIDKRHPRMSIGYYEPGHYSFIAVDGRSAASDGVRVVQLAWIYEALGCVRAYNMDGGDSALAYFGDTVLREDEERKLNGDSQRELWDIICIGEVSE